MKYDIYYMDKLVWSVYSWAKAYDFIFNSYHKFHIVESKSYDNHCDIFIADGVR